jgi:threonine dehydrogenase-like Zn-dependent dehydrogenase
MYKIAIVGLGPAGILSLALLPKSLYSKIVVFEPGEVGGDLATRYATVLANITKADIVSAFQSVDAWHDELFPRLAGYKDSECPRLGEVACQLRELTLPELPKVRHVKEKVDKIIRHGDSWELKTATDVFEVKKVILCTGAIPKYFDKATLPLNTAMNFVALALSVNRQMKIVVFGTSHSGTLVLGNLNRLGFTNVSAIYKSDVPFVYARDGNPEGIKQESAAIADAILSGAWGVRTPRLLHLEKDAAAVAAAVAAADKIIYAAGFETPQQTYEEDGVTKPLIHVEGSFRDVSDIYGFGIAYPAPYEAPDGNTYKDISFAGFIAAIKRALPLILQLDP